MHSAVDDQTGHLVDDVLEIKLGNAVAFEVGSRIQEIDCVRNSVFDRKLNGIKLSGTR